PHAGAVAALADSAVAAAACAVGAPAATTVCASALRPGVAAATPDVGAVAPLVGAAEPDCDGPQPTSIAAPAAPRSASTSRRLRIRPTCRSSLSIEILSSLEADCDRAIDRDRNAPQQISSHPCHVPYQSRAADEDSPAAGFLYLPRLFPNPYTGRKLRTAFYVEGPVVGAWGAA